MGEGPGAVDLKYERDRFVAFAFAMADAFVELDREYVIRYATGAVQWLTGATAEQLSGRAVGDLVDAKDKMLLKAALEAAQRQGRFGPVALSFARGTKKAARVTAFGTYLPMRGGRTFIALSAQRMVPATPQRAAGDVDQQTGLLAKQAFTEIAQQAIKAGEESGRKYNMTLLDLDGIDALKMRTDSATADRVLGDIATYLQANSVNGASAGRMADDKFGLVHEADLDVTALKQTISDTAKQADPNGAGLEVGANTVALEATMSEADNAKALLYTINKFSDSHGDFTITQLTDGYKLMLDETRTKIASFKKMLATSAFDVVFQPIVALSDRKVHHYEALVRPRESGPDASPFKLITFAEEVGLIGDFDLAMTRKVIARIKAARERGDAISIAVNLSGRSLESPAFIDELHKELKRCGDIRNELMFEVTESSKITDLEATNKILHGLRELGHHVCLDDFGAGAAAFQYLRALEVDFVKIDGLYVREALTKPNGKVFLKSMAGLCADLGIETVGEFVETEEVAKFLQQVGVNYGQGYLFGKPGMGVSGKKIGS